MFPTEGFWRHPQGGGEGAARTAKPREEEGFAVSVGGFPREEEGESRRNRETQGRRRVSPYLVGGALREEERGAA